MIKLLAFLLICAWVGAWMHYATADRLECMAHGVEFGGESLGLDGFCLYGDIMVPVEWYGRKW